MPLARYEAEAAFATRDGIEKNPRRASSNFGVWCGRRGRAFSRARPFRLSSGGAGAIHVLGRDGVDILRC